MGKLDVRSWRLTVGVLAAAKRGLKVESHKTNREIFERRHTALQNVTTSL